VIQLAAHQIEAVARAQEILARFGGVILADDVGLGKSFVAASVAAATHCPVEFIVPAGLVAQWTSTLADFGIDARITTHDRIVNEPFTPTAAGERLIIVDEAHAFRNPQTQRYHALARRSIGARVMLVTATPLCNSPDDLHALVAVIAADDALRSHGVPSIDDAFRDRDKEDIAAVLRMLVIRRGREVLEEHLRFGSLQRRVIRHDVPHVAIDDLQFPLIGGEAALLRGILWRRLESSEAALRESLKRQTRFYERALDCLAAGRTLTKRDYREAFGTEDADAFQEVLFWEMFASEESRADADAIRAEVARIDAIARELKGDSTKSALLSTICKESSEPVLIFTAAIATANDIFATLTKVRRAGIVTSRAALPVNALDAFARGTLDAIVCTDLAAEGLNLQRAGVVVHYDLPWNPVKIDQRNGRAFRIGQLRETVEAIYFVPRGRRTRVVRAIARKNRDRRRLLTSHDGQPGAAVLHQSLDLLPVHLPRSSPAVALLGALRSSGLDPPPSLARRYRAGLEHLLAEMSGEYLDARRVSDLTSLMERERIIAGGASFGSADR
jgi:superfamily II DNA or RNA helicase